MAATRATHADPPAATQAAAPTLAVVPAPPSWPRSCVLIPELAQAPNLVALADAAGWSGAAAVELRYPLNADQALAADTTARLGYHGGTLYLRLEAKPTPDEPPAATRPDAGGGRGGDILLAPADDPRPVKLFSFDAGGGRREQALTYVGLSGDTNADPSWTCPWQVATGTVEGRWVAQVALPLETALGFPAATGDAFRLDVVRRRAGAPQPALHWSAVRGPLDCNPPDFGLAVLAGPRPERFGLAHLSPRGRRGIVGTTSAQPATGLPGDAVTLVIDHPFAQALTERNGPQSVSARLIEAGGREAARLDTRIAAWPAAFRLLLAAEKPGDYRLLLGMGGERGPAFDTPVSWRSSVLVDAADPLACAIEGPHRFTQHPRGVNASVTVLAKGSRLTARTSARAASLRLPVVFSSPGPGYERFLGGGLRWRVDAGPWHDLWLADTAPEVVLAQDFGAPPAEGHAVEIEPLGNEGSLLGFRFSAEPIGGIVGTVHSADYDELLTDVRADAFAADRPSDPPLRTAYTRQPINGRFAVLGLPVGIYRLRITAAGWPPAEVSGLEVARAGATADAGTVMLGDRPDTTSWGFVGPRMGRTACLQPGGTFEMTQATAGPPMTIELASTFHRFKPERVAAKAAHASPSSPMERVTYRIPAGTPMDMYALRVTQSYPGYPPYVQESPHAVWVGEPLPETFRLAGVSHMNTSVEETAEYLARVGETAQLAGARALLVANEVNGAYVAGALRPLRIPCVVTGGNHTMARWSTFFADRPAALDDGPLRIVSHSGDPGEPWAEVDALLRGRSDATARVLACYEGYAPLGLIRESGVDLVFDGHSGDPHPDRKAFPPGVLHLRAPGQESIRWLPMTRDGADPSAPDEEAVPVIVVPRWGPAPIRAEFSAPLDGSAASLEARVVNETDLPLPSARLRLVLRAGAYEVEGARVVQTFISDDGTKRVIDAAFAAAAQSVSVIGVKPSTGESEKTAHPDTAPTIR